MSEALQSGIRGSTLQVLPGTRHLSLVESASARKLIHEHFNAHSALA
jgi:hypothetical protein